MQSPLTPVIFDRSTVADHASDVELRAWAQGRRIFLSSVMLPLKAERKAAAEKIAAIGATPVCFENFGGRDDDPEQAYLTELSSSTDYLGLLDEFYGRPGAGGLSATHIEFREAERLGLRMSIWVGSSTSPEPAQRDFINEVRQLHTTGNYSSPDDLARRLEERLCRLASESMSPWVKLGHVVFRASELRHDGDTIHVRARSNDANVLAALEGFRPQQFRSSARLPFATGDTAHEVDVTNVAVTITTGRTREIEIVLGVIPPVLDMLSVSSYSVNGTQYSVEELGELMIRVSALGEANPLGTMGFLLEQPNPVAIVDAARLPADAVEPVARLLFAEMLCLAGRADRIKAFRLGPSTGSSRRLRISWLTPRRYTNVEPTERSVEGMTGRSVSATP